MPCQPRRIRRTRIPGPTLAGPMVEDRHDLNSFSGERALSAAGRRERREKQLLRIPESHEIELPAVEGSLPVDETIHLSALCIESHDAREAVDQAERVVQRDGGELLGGRLAE